LTRGPEAQIPRGSTLDIVLERDLTLDSSYLDFDGVGRQAHVTRSVSRRDRDE
jgi:hypothetical protein